MSIKMCQYKILLQQNFIVNYIVKLYNLKNSIYVYYKKKKKKQNIVDNTTNTTIKIPNRRNRITIALKT